MIQKTVRWLDNLYGIELVFPSGLTRLNPYGMDIFISDGIINKIETNPDILTREDYTISDIFTMYGSPTQIMIRAVGISMIGSEGYFNIALFYGNKGFMAVFNGTNALGKVVYICPDSDIGTHGTWLFWSPKNPVTFEEAAETTRLIDPLINQVFLPLEKATGMTIEDFYNKYKDPANKYYCFDMPATE